jgi:hypothetical protein
MEADIKSLKLRPRRFSLRLLLLAVTLACVYLGTWQATAMFGVDDVSKRLADENSGAFVPVVYKAPLLVASEHYAVSMGAHGEPSEAHTRVDYYFWFAGWTVRLPFEREIVRQVEK